MSSKKLLFKKGNDGWKMITVTFDGSVPKLYINSDEITLASSNYVGTYVKLKYNTYYMRFGHQTYGGLIDEISFHKNRQLAKADIDLIYKNGFGNVYANWTSDLKTDLECYYDFSQSGDLVNGRTDGVQYYGTTNVSSKWGDACNFTNPSISGIYYAYTLMLPTNTTNDLPFTYNIWIKPTSIGNTIMRMYGTAGETSILYLMTLNPTSLAITFYSQGNASIYKQFIYNFPTLL